MFYSKKYIVAFVMMLSLLLVGCGHGLGTMEKPGFFHVKDDFIDVKVPTILNLGGDSGRFFARLDQKRFSKRARTLRYNVYFKGEWIGRIGVSLDDVRGDKKDDYIHYLKHRMAMDWGFNRYDFIFSGNSHYAFCKGMGARSANGTTHARFGHVDFSFQSKGLAIKTVFKTTEDNYLDVLHAYEKEMLFDDQGRLSTGKQDNYFMFHLMYMTQKFKRQCVFSDTH